MLEQLAALAGGAHARAPGSRCRRQMRENGVTYNVYADPQGADRPWELDLLPLILPQEEWQRDRGGDRAARHAAQRDPASIVYGQQRLLKRGPAAAGAGLRACRLPAPVPRHRAARRRAAARLRRRPRALARRPLVGDRRSHAGALGRRLCAREPHRHLARLPRAVPRPQVQHLAHFFATLRDSLAHWAPPTDDGSRCTVLLTPGPHNETYFEHAYLARYLGFPLVEGSDLTVRDGCVWLKTLSGLKRVHAILRRLDDDYCDPLELRSDSALGIAGLVRRRARAATCSSPTRSARACSSPARCSASCRPLRAAARRGAADAVGRHLVVRRAGGARRRARATSTRLVFKAAFPQLRVEPMFGEDLTSAARERVVGACCGARPNDYVAQELVQLSQAPVLGPRAPAPLAARASACASSPGARPTATSSCRAA